jgi:crotonobetainyl-CoA:carnitine CoA-transferase CaiB-like acyl-CoA transferase
MSIAKVAGLGQDNETILAELAGLSPAEIGELESEGVVFGAPRPDEPRP